MEENFNANNSLILTEPFGDVNPFPLDPIWPYGTDRSESGSFAGPSLIPEQVPVIIDTVTGDDLWPGQIPEAIAASPPSLLPPPSPALADPLLGNSGVVNQEAIASLGQRETRLLPEPESEPDILQFLTNMFYNPGETVRFRGQVYEGDRDLALVDFWLQKDGGEWVDISDGTEFVPDSNNPGYALFNYELSGLEPGRYQLRGTVIDRDSTSQTAIQSFTVLDLPSQTFLPDNVRHAIAQAANLDNYSPAALEATRRWVVSLAEGQSSSELAPLVGAVDLGATAHIPGTYIWEFSEDVNPMDLGLASLVQFSYPLVEVDLRSQFIPDDEFFGRQWHLLNNGQTGNLSGVDANVTTAWDSVTGAGVVIAIVDDGLQHTHPDLQPNYRPDLSRDLNEGDPENRIYDGDPAPLSLLTFEADIDSPEPIVDGDLSFFFIPVSRKGTVDNLTLTWDIDHPDPRDLSVFLIGPTNTQWELSDVGASGSIATNFFNGINAGGNWTLVFDDAILGNEGFLNSWSLTVETSDAHGTAVAGVAAAKGNNTVGISGVAPDAGLAGLRLTADSVGPIQIADALYSDLNQSIDIFNNSWKPPALWNDRGLAMMALHQGVTNGRGGLGNIYVFGAGNDWLEGANYRENLNYNPLASSRYTIPVGAIDHTGKKASYSQEGAPLLVSAPSGGVGKNSIGISTTDLLGNKGRNVDGNGQYGANLDNLDYTNDFDGTSAATPVVSGVAALMLEANQNLTWRDVQHILVQTANRDLIDDSEANWSGELGDVLRHSDKYGFGVVDAAAAVNAAASWTPVAPEVSISTGNMSANKRFPKNIPFGFTEEVEIDQDITVEWVEVAFDGTHELWGDLEIVLTAPDGTESVLTNSLDASVSFIEKRLFDDGNDRHTWVLTSARHWGTSSQGEWKLEVRDNHPGKNGTWHSWQLHIYGTKPTVSVEATAPDASEDGNSGALLFTRTGNIDNPLTVNYSLDGTATAGADYEALAETVEIPAGEDSVTVSIIPKDDDEVEGDETVFVVIDADDAYDIGTNSSATVNIADNDEPLRHVVTNTNDSGVGSLRDAIAWANENPGRDTITFNILGNGPHTISPTSALPDITEEVAIDGWSQNGGTPPATPLIELSGSNAGDSNGLRITGSNVEVRGLVINNWQRNGIEIAESATDNWIYGNFIGTNKEGTEAIANLLDGVELLGDNNIIGTNGDNIADGTEGNLIAGNQRNGVSIRDASFNILAGNRIGTNLDGTGAIANLLNGVNVRDDNNIIGTNGDGIADATEGNLISGNGNNGVSIVDASSNIVAGNSIGTNKDGTEAIANLLNGVNVRGDNNIIGTNGDGIADATEGNLISGNEHNGVSIVDASDNIVAGNSIGTNLDGTGAIANLRDGVEDVRGDNNIIGTNGDGIADAVEGNLISGNEQNGVSIVDASFTIVAGNQIGTNKDGTGAIANLRDGVDVRGDNNIIGTNGDSVADTIESNLISGNGQDGVSIVYANDNIVAGNHIGTNKNGTGAIANLLDGVDMRGNNNIIGTNGDGIADGAEGNLISGNGQDGVNIMIDPNIIDARENIVAGNHIGTNKEGTGAIANLGDGVDVRGNNNIIGTNGDGIADSVEGNLISGNEHNGVRIANVSDNIVAGNSIGTNKQGTGAIGNSLFGVSVTGDNNIIGTNGDGTADADEANLISGNLGSSGLYIFAESNIIAGNHIGTNLEGTEALANDSWGVWIGGGANNIIGTNGDGTADAAEGNLISGNSSTGVVIYSDFNIVAGNRIGTNRDGTGAIPNGEDGVSGGGKNNRIGGTNTGEGNIIAFNNRHGVWVGGSIQGNAIFANAGLGINLGNDAVTANDLGDRDTGVNNLQNFPELTLATSDTATTTIQGTLNSTANSTFTLEFFANSALDESGYGEGEIFLGSQEVTTDSSGNASFTGNFSTPLTASQFITATATDPDGNTSEFSQGVALSELLAEYSDLSNTNTVIDFDYVRSAPGVSFSSSDRYSVSGGRADEDFPELVGGKGLLAGDLGHKPITITFDSPVSEVGLGWYHAKSPSNIFQVFDRNGVLLGEVTPSPLAPSDEPAKHWAGFVGIKRADNDIAKAVVLPDPEDWYVIDNVSFGRLGNN